MARLLSFFTICLMASCSLGQSNNFLGCDWYISADFKYQGKLENEYGAVLNEAIWANLDFTNPKYISFNVYPFTMERYEASSGGVSLLKTERFEGYEIHFFHQKVYDAEVFRHVIVNGDGKHISLIGFTNDDFSNFGVNCIN